VPTPKGCGAAIRATAINTDLRIVVSHRAVRRLFEITGMNKIMHIYASLEAAQDDVADAARHLASVVRAEPP
jgi:anti-anti-sigma regulatory factor